MYTLLMIDHFADQRSRREPQGCKETSGLDSLPLSIALEGKLAQINWRMTPVLRERELGVQLTHADGFIIAAPTVQSAEWCRKIRAHRELPVFFWCDRLTWPKGSAKPDGEWSGMLGAGMSAEELQCALMFGIDRFRERQDWLREREQLLGRLEERRWIEQAKGILCEVKGINEAEAYDFLRKQAMNERKRMADVASSIVSVYRLLKEKRQNTRKR